MPLSDTAQAVIMIIGSVCLSVGAYLSQQTHNPNYVIVGGVLQAIAFGLKEALGSKDNKQKN
jgi:hypothetical protein